MVVQNIADYHRHFPRTPGLVRGEWTPDYLSDPWSLSCLHEAAPEARLLVVLRDPVDRFISALTHVVAEGRRPTTDDARVAFQRGSYASALASVLRLYQRESLLVLQYERCKAEPRPQLRRTFAHLRLEDHPVGSDLILRPANATEVPKIDLARSVRDRLCEAYRPDVDALIAAFPELDLALWPNFSD